MGMLDKVLDFIIPRKCAGCGRPSEIFCRACFSASYSDKTACLFCGSRNRAGEVCASCRRRAKTPLRNVLWAGRYDDELKKAIWALKYGKRREMAKPLGEMLARKFFDVWFSQAEQDFLAIPIPLHFKKEYERGFNQALLLAEEFSKITGIPCEKKLLIKTRETEEQVKVQDKKLRLANLENAFDVPPGKRIVKWPAVILIDDVSTTGATLTHAANALKEAGAKNITGLTAAHG